MKNPHSGLTNKEKQIMDYLTAVVAIYHALPNNQEDMESFMESIHDMQKIISIRITRRDYPDYWRTPY